MATEKKLPTKPSTMRHARPQAPKGNPEPLPPMTALHCPECHGIGVLRMKAATTIVKGGHVHACRVGHLWSPQSDGGDSALKSYADARERRRVARARVPQAAAPEGMTATAKIVNTTPDPTPDPE